MSTPSGVLPIDKPSGPTSHDIVARARRALRIRRIGHTGTLDPFASGLLLLCVGTATRLAEYLTALPKSYRATLRLGVRTDTDDREGEVVAMEDGWRSIDRERLLAALERQRGEILQVPPQYSAKRVEGERMYDVARRGGQVALEAVPVQVERIELTRFAPPDADFEVDCSSGTYIRAIARDVGAELGVGAHLTELRRTRIGAFSADAALSLDDLEDAGTVAAALVAPAAAVGHLAAVTLAEDEIAAVRNGRPVARESAEVGGPVALLSPAGELVAIAESAGGRLQPRKVFA